MRAHAGVEADALLGDGTEPRTRIRWMRSQAPLMFRQTRHQVPPQLGHWGLLPAACASVSLIAGAAGPLGGDQLRLDIVVGEGATLLVSAVAATLILPGPHGEESRSDVHITVATGGTLVWLPGLQIAAADCRHIAATHVELRGDARFYAREELLLGRAGELPGSVQQRLRVRRDGSPLFDQEIAVGSVAGEGGLGAVAGWQGSAVTGDRRALGSVLIVDPGRADNAFPPVSAAFPDTAVMNLDEQSVLISSAAADAILLRRQLNAALAGTLAGAPS